MIYDLDNVIEKEERDLARNKLVKSIYPDAKLVEVEPPKYGKKADHWYKYYISPSINKTYTKLEFRTNYSNLYMLPHCPIKFVHNGQEETVNVYSIPARKKLAHRRSGYGNKKGVIYFSRLSFNIKGNNFKESILKDCAAGIMEFIAANPDCQLDDANLDERVKKLLVFI